MIIPIKKESQSEAAAIVTLTLLAARCVAGLTSRPDAIRLLSDAGIIDAATIAAFGVGAGNDELLNDLNENQRQQMADVGLLRRSVSILTGPGFIIPTRDPRDYATIVGFVKVSPGQLKHGHVGAVAGVACGVDVIDAPKIVITDNPLLALRLHQAGVRGVVLLEDAAVIAPLIDWFASRELVVCGYKLAGIAAIRAELGPSGERAASAHVNGDLERSTAGSLRLLGLDRETLRGPIEPAPPITDRLLNELHAYAVGQLAHPDAPAALARWGFDHPELAEAWRVGFLPSDFRSALSPEQRRTLAGHFHGGSVIIPAFDASGHIVVDVACAQGCDGGRCEFSVWENPRGLIAASVATAFDRITMTDSLTQATRWFAAGDRAVLWLRGAADAQANAQRLAGGSIRSAIVRARRERDAIAEALTAAGIAVTMKSFREESDQEPDDNQRHHESETTPLLFPTQEAATPVPKSIPSPLPSLTLIRHDSTRDEAVFSIDDVTITAQVPWSNETVLRVTLARHDRRCVDRVDVAQPAQRRRFAASAALRLDLLPAVIEHALADLLPALRQVVEAEDEPVSPLATLMSDAEQAESLAALRQPDVTRLVLTWLGDMGLHGDDDERLLLFLSALSRKSDEPMWLALLTASPLAGQPIDIIAEATPPEEIVAASRLTDNALMNTDPGALRHRLLVLHDAERVSPAVATALRILHRRGALSGTKVERDPIRGTVRTTVVETIGPVALLTTGTMNIDEQLRPCVVEITADESPAQTERMLAAERNRRADPRRHALARAQSLRRLRNLQRHIAVRSVLIPFADDVAISAINPHAQREQATLLALITAHALLHQHQRLSDDGAVVATRADLAVAQRLAQRFASAQANGLGAHAQRLLTAIRAAGVQSVTLDLLEASILPGWSRHVLRVGLTELVAVNYLASPRLGRGHRRTYHVVRSGPIKYDRDKREVSKLAEVGDDQKPTLSDVRKSG